MLRLPKPWIERWQLQDTFNHLFAVDGEVYREQGCRKTLRFTVAGSSYFAKFHCGVGWKETFKNLLQLRLPVFSAQNEWRAIRRLEQLDIQTVRLVGYGKRGWNPIRQQSFLITEELANTVSLESFCRNWRSSPPRCALKWTLIDKVATIARSLHENGINHRDFYICHFLLDISRGRTRVDHRELQLYLIDLHRTQIRKHTPRRWRVKDIGSLYFSSMDVGLTKRDLLRFVRAYMNKPLRASLGEDELFWCQVWRRAISLYRRHFHKDPTLVW
jgi:heptose I phosphotransferase